MKEKDNLVGLARKRERETRPAIKQNERRPIGKRRRRTIEEKKEKGEITARVMDRHLNTEKGIAVKRLYMTRMDLYVDKHI